jgi:hypothetical protein
MKKRNSMNISPDLVKFAEAENGSIKEEPESIEDDDIVKINKEI